MNIYKPRLHGNGIGSLWKREAKYFKKLGSGYVLETYIHLNKYIHI